jgi:hypothetical protein
MKKLSNLKGAKTLSKKEQLNINGGGLGNGNIYGRCSSPDGQYNSVQCHNTGEACKYIENGYPSHGLCLSDHCCYPL